MKNALEVSIAGQRYLLKSDAAEERLAAIAQLVSSKIEEVGAGTRQLTTDRLAILAAVGLAEELLRAREDSRRLKDAVRQRTERLLTCLHSLQPLAAAAGRAPEVAVEVAVAASSPADERGPPEDATAPDEPPASGPGPGGRA